MQQIWPTNQVQEKQCIEFSSPFNNLTLFLWAYGEENEKLWKIGKNIKSENTKSKFQCSYINTSKIHKGTVMPASNQPKISIYKCVV